MCAHARVCMCIRIYVRVMLNRGSLFPQWKTNCLCTKWSAKQDVEFIWRSESCVRQWVLQLCEGLCWMFDPVQHHVALAGLRLRAPPRTAHCLLMVWWGDCSSLTNGNRLQAIKQALASIAFGLMSWGLQGRHAESFHLCLDQNKNVFFYFLCLAWTYCFISAHFSELSPQLQCVFLNRKLRSPVISFKQVVTTHITSGRNL